MVMTYDEWYQHELKINPFAKSTHVNELRVQYQAYLKRVQPRILTFEEWSIEESKKIIYFNGWSESVKRAAYQSYLLSVGGVKVDEEKVKREQQAIIDKERKRLEEIMVHTVGHLDNGTVVFTRGTNKAKLVQDGNTVREITGEELKQLSRRTIHYDNAPDRIVCLETDPVKAWEMCYYEWWDEDVVKHYIKNWKESVGNPTHEQLYHALRTPLNEEFKCINAALWPKRAVDPKKSVANDYYYDYEVPYWGIVWRWWYAGGALRTQGRDQQEQLSRKFNWKRIVSDGQSVIEGAKDDVDETIDNWNDGIDQALKNLGNYLSPSPETWTKIYIGFGLILLVGGLGSGAALVHEIKK